MIFSIFIENKGKLQKKLPWEFNYKKSFVLQKDEEFREKKSRNQYFSLS